MSPKVLFVTNTMGRGGAEVALLEMLKQLPAEWDVSLYPIISLGEMFQQVPAGVKLLSKHFDSHSLFSFCGKVKIAFISLKAVICHFRSFLSSFSRCSQMEKRSRLRNIIWRQITDNIPALNGEYDLAVAFLEGASTFYTASKVKAKHKACFVHVNYQLGGNNIELDNGCYDAFDKIFTVSDSVRDSFIEIYPQHADHVFVLRNHIDADRIISLSKEYVGFSDGFEGIRLVSVGRLTYQKAYDIAIPAFAELKKICAIPVRWYVLGFGEDYNHLKKMAAAYGLKNDFIFLGDRDNPYPLVAKADIFVHATRFEGSSIALREAQVLGKPIVASDCPENIEILTPYKDSLVTKLEPISIANTIYQLIQDTELRNQIANSASLIDQNKDVSYSELFSLISN